MSGRGRGRARGCLLRLGVAVGVLLALGVGWANFVPRPLETALVYLINGVDTVLCGLGLCEPDAIDDLRVTVAVDETGPAPIVAIDVDPAGRVFSAQSDRLNSGVLDNRDFSETLLDDELALRSVDDRQAMIDREIAAGRREADEFTRASDVVAVFEDRDGDGTLETRTEIASASEPTVGVGAGVLVRGTDVYWTAIPDVWRIRDSDDDGLADTKERLSTGWGVHWAFIGHDMHGLVQGPDGKIYFSIGDRGFQAESPDGRILRPDITNGRGAVLRMNPDGSDLEIYAQGFRNPQELAFDDFGNLFTADNNSDSIDEARIAYIVEGGDAGWTFPYQLLREEEYERGPWNAEKLWYREHDGQPAYVIPPLRFIGRGPAGFAHAPGLGLPERYRGHFLAADYAYFRPISGIRTFRVESEGAGFRSTDPEWLVSNVLVTDLAFTLDGAMYVSAYRQIKPPRGRLYRIETVPEALESQAAQIEEMQAILAEGVSARTDAELVRLLGFPDRRVRLPAQFELSARGATDALTEIARDRDALLLARLHALWGLQQIGASAFHGPAWSSLDWLSSEPAEVRAQVVRVLGEAGVERLSPEIAAFVRDDDARVRYFAAISLGKLGDVRQAPAIADMLRENDGDDIYLRHAGALAFAQMNDREVLATFAGDSSAAVRMAALLAMRRVRDPRIEGFLDDEDPRLVVEAARAIHDMPIPEALPALAALAGTSLPYTDEDPQTTYALHRRALNANLRLGTSVAAERIAAHAADAANPEEMRREALVALGRFAEPPPRDPVLGLWNPLESRPREIVHAAIDAHVPALLDGPLQGQALDVAASYDRVPLEDEELVARIRDDGADARTRVASLRALASRAEEAGDGASGATLGRAVALGLGANEPALRAEARDVLARHDATAALESIDALPDDAPTRERQRAIATLSSIETPASDERLATQMDRLADATLPPDVHLDVLEAARGRSALADAVAGYESGLDSADPLAPYRVALVGGDVVRGRAVFNGNGDCKRCHAVVGRGGSTGPPLDGIGSRLATEQILEAVLFPDASIAPGYTSPDSGSAMPPIGVELPARELRDLMAYLASLK